MASHLRVSSHAFSWEREGGREKEKDGGRKRKREGERETEKGRRRKRRRRRRGGVIALFSFSFSKGINSIMNSSKPNLFPKASPLDIIILY
jgi:hypothetical protein